MRKITKKQRATPLKKTSRLRDHAENDFVDCDKLITNLCGRRIELTGEQQKEVLEFTYAIGSCVQDSGDPLKNADKYSDVQLRGLLLMIMKKSIDSVPADKLLDIVLEFMCRKEDENRKMTIH